MQRGEKFTTPELMRACAGAGKTYELSTRYIELLAANEIPERILATTFTRKAAGEILERIYGRLADAALDSKAAAQLASDIAQPKFSSIDAQKLLSSLISAQHRLNIRTLDSFFAGITRSFSSELGFAPSWRLEDENIRRRLIRNAVGELCSTADRAEIADLVGLLSRREFARSVHEAFSNDLVRLMDLYQESEQSAWSWISVPKGLDKKEIEAVLQRIEALPLPRTGKGEVNSFWSNAVPKLLGFARNQDWENLFKASLGEAILSGAANFSRIAIPDSFRHEVLQLSLAAACDLLSKLKRSTEATRTLIAKMDKIYCTQRESSQALFHDDLKRVLSSGLRELSDRGGLEEIYYRLDARIAHLLLDEFQDTSRLDWEVLHPVVDEVLSKAGEQHSFFCVGDTKQAIYGWRGGVAEIFNNITNCWSQVRATTLDASRRLAPAVTECVNAVFSKLKSNSVLGEYGETAERWSQRFSAHSSHRIEPRGYAAYIAVESDDDDEKRGAVTKRVAALVKELHTKRPDLSIAILVRRNKTVAEIMSELGSAQNGIAASEEGGNPLTDSESVNLILSLLTLVDHPADKVASFHLGGSNLAKKFGLTTKFVEASALKVSSDYRQRILEQGLGQVILTLVNDLSVYASPREARRLRQLVEAAYKYEAALRSSPRLLDFVQLVENKRVEDPSGERVRVMTVHQAKGLEFDVVILAELDERLSKATPEVVLTHRADPLSALDRIAKAGTKVTRMLSAELTAMDQARQTEECLESLSLLYVAMTRAKYALYMVAKNASNTPTFAALLTAALSPSTGKESSGVLYECGEATWIDTVAKTSSSTPIVENLKPRALHGYAAIRGIKREIPSEREGFGKIDLKTVLMLGSAEARSRGVLFHRFFEELAFLDQAQPNIDELVNLKLSSQILHSQDHLREMARQFIEGLKAKEIGNLLISSRYKGTTKIFNELPFAYLRGDVLVNGSIDRIVVTYQGDKPIAAELFDLKSDAPASQDLDQIQKWLNSRVDYYKPQIELYREAVQRIFSLSGNDIRCTLIFIGVGGAYEL